MKIIFATGPVYAQKLPVAVLFAAEKEPPTLPPSARLLLSRLNDKEFSGADRQLCLLPATGLAGFQAERLLLVGLGKRAELSPEKIRRAVGLAVKRLASLGLTRAGFALFENQIEPTVEAAILANYRFTRFKAPDDNRTTLETLTLTLAGNADLRAARETVHRTEIVANAANYARELGNLPANIITPATLADHARATARECGLKCTVLDKTELKRRGFGGLLAVGGGSHNDPRLIVLEYAPPQRRSGRGAAASRKPVALVGKALTFDSGGISIKPADKMDEMKFDKCGGLAVLGAMRAIAQLKLHRPVLGIIGAAENMPGATSYRPGDIVTSYPGKDKRGVTIEVLNTDAEGRIVLGDALAYARQRDAAQIIDLATLTGACTIALGSHAAGLLGNNEELISQLRGAGEATGERCWPLPLWPEYKDMIKSDVADHKNTGGRYGGTSTAAAFLARYVGDTPWAHLDIAGTAWTTEDRPYFNKGATAFGLRLLLHWLQQDRPESNRA